MRLTPDACRRPCDARRLLAEIPEEALPVAAIARRVEARGNLIRLYQRR